MYFDLPGINLIIRFSPSSERSRLKKNKTVGGGGGDSPPLSEMYHKSSSFVFVKLKKKKTMITQACALGWIGKLSRVDFVSPPLMAGMFYDHMPKPLQLPPFDVEKQSVHLHAEFSHTYFN